VLHLRFTFQAVSIPCRLDALIAVTGRKSVHALAFSSLSRVAMKSRTMAKNAKPNRILITLPMIGYAEFNNKPLSASSRCLLMKDKAPIETKPAPKTKSPALVDSFSKSRGVFMFGSGQTLIGTGSCYPVKYWSGSPHIQGWLPAHSLVGSATTCSWPLEQ
jgi:hypothetical protein